MSAAPQRLRDLARCFQGVIPSIVATADAEGAPNVTYVSQVFLLDDRHVALSRQFFNKTARNLDANPRAQVELYDPFDFQAWRLRLRFLRTETEGPLFESMALRIQAIASHTGMEGIFKLIGADVFEVESAIPVEGFLSGVAPARPDDALTLDGRRTELRGLQWVSDRINRSSELGEMLDSVLEALESYFGFTHSMLLLPDDAGTRLATIASRGYDGEGVGAEVAVGDGLIGTVARQKKVLRISGLDRELSYGRAMRRAMVAADGGNALSAEIPLPGLPDARSALLIPLCLCDRLMGVLAAESHDALAFDEWHEAYLEVLGNQIALGIERMSETPPEEPAVELDPSPPPEHDGRRHSFCFYKNDDAVFVDGEYLVRNVPGRILWKLLGQWSREGRTEFTNRELRLDPGLGLPALRDNLESRLVLLRRRLEVKCPDVRLVPTARGRFSLRVDATVELVERDSG